MRVYWTLDRLGVAGTLPVIPTVPDYLTAKEKTVLGEAKPPNSVCL